MKPLIETNRQWPYQRSWPFSDGVKLELGTRTLIMGILNTTPDSFSDGGRYDDIEAAVKHAQIMAEDGADIIDIGGESTRPGSDSVSLEEELFRVLPTIQAIRKALPAMPLSIDTYKAETARQSLEAGAHIINDIWGLKGDPQWPRWLLNMAVLLLLVTTVMLVITTIFCPMWSKICKEVLYWPIRQVLKIQPSGWIPGLASPKTMKRTYA